MENAKKDYRSPELFDLNATEAIGACTIGGQVSECTTGGMYRVGECTAGSGVKPLDCANGSDAWMKHTKR